MPTRLFIVFAVSVLGLASGCDKSSAPSPVAAPATPAAVAAATISPLSPVSEEKARDFAQRMIEAIARVEHRPMD